MCVGQRQVIASGPAKLRRMFSLYVPDVRFPSMLRVAL